MHPRTPVPVLVTMAAVAVALVVTGCDAAAAPSSTEPRLSTPAASSGTPSASVPGQPSASASQDESPSASQGALALPSTCSGPATPTTAQTEGPYFKAGSPERSDLTEPGMTGTPLTLVAVVVTTDCTPVAGAVVDLWQADASGAYDNAGYTLRGHVTTDAAGRFTVQTIVPGEYPGRTEHIHVKVTPPGGSTLTTQLYFPGVDANDTDGIFSPDLVLAVSDAGDGLVGTFTFVLPAG